MTKATTHGHGDLITVVVFHKFTNCFRSEWGASLYADDRSVIETARRRGIALPQALRLTLQGTPLPIVA